MWRISLAWILTSNACPGREKGRNAGNSWNSKGVDGEWWWVDGDFMEFYWVWWFNDLMEVVLGFDRDSMDFKQVCFLGIKSRSQILGVKMGDSQTNVGRKKMSFRLVEPLKLMKFLDPDPDMSNPLRTLLKFTNAWRTWLWFFFAHNRVVEAPSSTETISARQPCAPPKGWWIMIPRRGVIGWYRGNVRCFCIQTYVTAGLIL